MFGCRIENRWPLFDRVCVSGASPDSFRYEKSTAFPVIRRLYLARDIVAVTTVGHLQT